MSKYGGSPFVDLDFLKRLMKTPSPSGHELAAQKVWADTLRAKVNSLRVTFENDHMYNTFAKLTPTRGGVSKQTIMLAGHSDEIGLIVNYITEEGFINFETIGGVDAHIMPGKRVVILNEHNGNVHGVVGRKPIHLLEADERKAVAKLENLFIDIGVTSKAEALTLISVGDPVIFDMGFENLQGSIFTGRAFDDKIGSFIVGQTISILCNEIDDKDKTFPLHHTVVGVSTVQEEIGLRGARTSSFAADPTIGIAIDVTFANDHPGANKAKDDDVCLGKGPVLTVGPIVNKKLFKLLKATALAKNIPFQVVANPGGTGTDANAIHLNKAGVATALVSIPLRYMHTPSEVLNMDDVANTIKLLVETIRAMDSNFDVSEKI